MIRNILSNRISSLMFQSSLYFSSEKAHQVICEDVTPNVKRIILNNPKRRNSLSLNFMTELEDKLNEIQRGCEEHKFDVKAIILKSSIDTLSGGHDLREFKIADKNGRREVFEKAVSLMNSIENYFVPVIISIKGAAAAAGCQLVASCDIAVCSEKATFSTPGILAGLFCSTPAVAIGRALPRKIAMEMIITGEPISAQKALTYGLVNHVVPTEDVDAVSEKIAKNISLLSSTVIKLGKRVFIEQMQLSKNEAYELTSQTMLENLDYPDCVEGINAFLEKRKARWNQ